MHEHCEHIRKSRHHEQDVEHNLLDLEIEKLA